MKYALLIYNTDGQPYGELSPALAELLAGPHVLSWARLHAAETATTVSQRGGKTLLTDGPFVDSKEYLGGLIVIDGRDLDDALAFAAEVHATRPSVVIEVRPLLQDG